MDLISSLLRTFHLNSSIFKRAKFCGKWNMDASGSGQAVFHVVAGGQCWLHRPDADSPTPLYPGDLLILPRDAAHELSDSPTPTRQSPTDVRPLADTSAEGTGLLCGYFRFDDRVANPLLDALPDFLIVRHDSPGNEAMRQLIDLLVQEATDSQPGVEAVLDRLSDALFIQAIRAHLRSAGAKGLASALADPAVYRSLQLMHGFPGRDWALANLAREAAVSRSALVQRFSGAMGEPPMSYLARWRMKLATRWLREGKTVAEVAERCGYGSDAGFAKAFKRHVGVGPGVVRRRQGLEAVDAAAPR